MAGDITGKSIDEMNEYVKGCAVYRDRTIRDATGKVVGGIDVDLETYNELFKKKDKIGFSIVGTSEIKETPIT